MHGHNGVVFFHATADSLDSVGRIMDFSVLKEKLGGWIDEKWDHGFIYHVADKETENALACVNPQKKYAMPCNPTAENMAKYLLIDICPGLLEGTGVTVIKVVVWETENCFAEAELNE